MWDGTDDRAADDSLYHEVDRDRVALQATRGVAPSLGVILA